MKTLKLPNKYAIVFSAVFLVALVGLLTSLPNSGITGEFNRQTHPGLVKYVSCHYKDFDKYGECMRTERQEGIECTPSETVPQTYSRPPFPLDQHATGQFWRPCGNDRRF